MATELGNVVAEYKIDGTTNKVFDSSYINRTRAEIEKSIQRITEIGWKIIRSARKAGKDV